MLSLFPDLLDWSWYVPFFFRLFLGVYCGVVAWTLTRTVTPSEEDRFAWVGMRGLLFLLGALFILGIAVQAIGAIGFALALFALVLHAKHSPYAQESVAFYLLISLVSLALVLLGPGPYAFDLPL
jgi:hypothetical protein